MYKLTDATGRVLYVSREAEAAAIRAQLASQLEIAPPKIHISRKVLHLALFGVLFVLVLLMVFAAYFLLGEERPSSVIRPALTAHQRAQAFRL